MAMITAAAVALLAAAPAAFAAEATTDYTTYYAKPWEGVCATGTAQTPIDLPEQATPLAEQLAATFTFPTANGVQVQNTGFGLQVTWDSLSEGGPLPTLPAGGDSLTAVITNPETAVTKQVQMTPLQFHFHTVSEHAIEGMLYPAEVHVVTVVAQGQAPEWGCDEFWADPANTTPNFEKCVAVFGTMFKFGDASPEWLTSWISEMPTTASKVPSAVTTFDINMLLPEDKSYYTYYGSLTTPPCAEGLRWHVFDEALTISAADVAAMQQAVANSHAAADPAKTNNYRTNHRHLQPLNDRTVYYYEGSTDATAADAAAGASGRKLLL